MKTIIQLSEAEEAKALPMLLRHSSGTVLPHRIYVVSDEVAQKLREAVRFLIGSAMTQGNAYATAKAGGRHGAFYRLYMQRRTVEIRRGIRSLDQRIQEHREKMSDPVHNVAGYTQLDPRQQRALLESKWPADIRRLQEQRDILAGIGRERGS